MTSNGATTNGADRRVVTVSGRPGSGKSTVARNLAARLSYDHVSSGDFMRQMAAERGISVLELSKDAETSKVIDHEIDSRTATLGRERDGFVMDSRLAWHFIPDSIKVFLEVRPSVAARRIYGDDRTEERENVDFEATVASTAARAESEAKRYTDYYGVDYTDHTNYDLVVDTSEISVEAVVEAILEFLTEVPA
jgi:cytidylate kinase